MSWFVHFPEYECLVILWLIIVALAALTDMVPLGVFIYTAFFIFGLGAVVGIFLAGLIALFMDAN
jgi:uncharacterized protein YqfA (UPF0365 family)